MPAVVHIANTLAASNIALVDQSVSYQNSGLINASLRFVTTAAKRTLIERLFYVDAPPPVWPTGIDRGNLLTQRLYMVDRSVQQQYGLVTIDANYAGAFAKIVPVIVTERESAKEHSFFSSPFSITRVSPTGSTSTAENLVNFFIYKYAPIVLSVSFVQVGASASYTPQQPQLGDLYQLLSYKSSFWREAPELGWSGIKTFEQPRQYFIDILNKMTVVQDSKYNQITPSVKEVNVRWSAE